MIRFRFGRPGSGKTYRTVADIREALASGNRRLWLIVPEQQVYSAERDILSVLPPHAGRSFSIVSFSRLCNILADRFGGRTQHTVTRAMRSLLMWQNLRELSGLLETYTVSGGNDETLCLRMLAAADELKTCAIPSQKLEAAAAHLPENAPLRKKLRDLALVCASYDGLIREVYGENPADRLLRAAEQIEEHHFFEGATIFLDSFTSFTMQEYAVLRPILAQAEQVTVTFGCAGRSDLEPQFESIHDAVRRLTRLCEDARVPYEDEVLTDCYRTASPALLAMERGLWAFDRPADQLAVADEEGAVRLVVAPTLYDEAEAAALHMIELHKGGIPYEQIAVVVRDTSTWSGVLDAALDKHHVPFFLSERTDLSEKPAARLILTALRCLARRWQAEDLVALCKTGLCGVTAREVDYFAEYVDTWHLSGRRMTDTAWSMNPDGYVTELSPRAQNILLAANRVRETIMTPLLALEAGICSAENVTDQCRALYGYLSALGVRGRLSEQAEDFLRLGQVREAGEQVRLWSFLTETLATVASVMDSAEPMTAEELCTALSLVFSETDIGSVPARHDCVMVGSAATLRVDNIRAMLLLGLNEGEFPQSTRDDGLLSEQDKETLSSLGIELNSRADRRMSDELLYVWRAMSKPSDVLILSHSTTTPDGQARSPSAALARVCLILPGLRPTVFSSRMLEEGDAIRHRTPTTDTVARPVARRLLGDEIWLSQSRLQTYARCPYSYYGAYLLRLREPVEAKLNNLGAGIFLHHVMEQYLRRALDENNAIRPMAPGEVRALADAIMEAYIRELCGDEVQNGRLLHLFDRLRQVALVLIESIQAELSQSDFRVAGLEWDTHGRHPGDPRPLALTLELNDEDLPQTLPSHSAAVLGDPHFSELQGLPTRADSSPVRLLLGGRIDRVDMYRAADGDTVYIRVVDYKSSKHEFTINSLTEDMNIQLLLYLFTLCSPENRRLFANQNHQSAPLPTVRPAAAVYISPDESDREGAILPCRTGVILGDPEVIEAANRDPDGAYLPSVKRNRQGILAGRGLTSTEQMSELERLLLSTIRETAATMYRGCANRTPSEAACQFCRMKGSCGVSV